MHRHRDEQTEDGGAASAERGTMDGHVWTPAEGLRLSSPCAEGAFHASSSEHRDASREAEYVRKRAR